MDQLQETIWYGPRVNGLLSDSAPDAKDWNKLINFLDQMQLTILHVLYKLNWRETMHNLVFVGVASTDFISGQHPTGKLGTRLSKLGNIQLGRK